MKLFELGKQKYLNLPIDRFPAWTSHMMAPSPIQDGNDIKVFFGGWDTDGISSIYSIKMDLSSMEFSETTQRLELSPGNPGDFDENGVFPGSIFSVNGEVFLSYTGFQLGHKIPHYNFAGLAKLHGDDPLKRLSRAPILDRMDEGLYVRSGLSVLENCENELLIAYSAGSSFETINGKLRPNYNVLTQSLNSLSHIGKKGVMAITFDPKIEHGLGRPQLMKFDDKILIFYTRRMKDFAYKSGVAISLDGGATFTRQDYLLDGLGSNTFGHDDKMQYFPAPIAIGNKTYLFYNGNEFGKTGLGICELVWK